MRYKLTPSEECPLKWTIADTETGLVCSFKEGEFNETQEFCFMEDLKLDPADIASIVNAMTDWLRENHYELVFTSPQTIKAAARQQMGMRIRELREARKWSTRYLARLTGLQHSHIIRLESGKYAVTIDTLSVIAAALGVEIKID